VFIEAKDDGGGGDNWTTGPKSCKDPVKSSPPTNQHPVFYRPDALPVAQATVSKHSFIISENNMLHVRWITFNELLFVHLLFLPDTDIIMTLLQYFVCCITQ